MLVEIPYGKETISINIDEERVSGIVEANTVLVGDETETVQRAIQNPIGSMSLSEFLADVRDVLIIVNDATRPTPTADVLEVIYNLIKSLEGLRWRIVVNN